MSVSFEQEVETLLRTANSEENEDGSPMVAAQCYAAALNLLVQRAQAIGRHDAFFVAMRPLLINYLDRARLLADIAVDEASSSSSAAAA